MVTSAYKLIDVILATLATDANKRKARSYIIAIKIYQKVLKYIYGKNPLKSASEIFTIKQSIEKAIDLAGIPTYSLYYSPGISNDKLKVEMAPTIYK